MKILIVDDDNVSREHLKNILKEYGQCDLAEDGAEAIEAYKNSLFKDMPYDLVCLDVVMPKMDGFTVLRKIRKIEDTKGTKEGNETKIIITTSLAGLNKVVDYFSLKGATLCLHKPVVKRSLIDTMHQLGLIPN